MPGSPAAGPVPLRHGPRDVLLRTSDGDDVLRLQALLALRDVELDLLALLQLTEALSRDVRVVSEDVGAAAVLLNEAEALFRVEPLHGTCAHNSLSFWGADRTHTA